MMERRIPVRELASPALTRPRAQEAYERLRTYLAQAEVVVVLLDDVEMLSLSFLDQLVQELEKNRELDRVTFETHDPRTQEKIARLATLHPDSPIFLFSSSSERHRVLPARLEKEEPIFELAKVAGD